MMLGLACAALMGGAAAEKAAACAAMNNTGCTMNPYTTKTTADAATCCAACASDPKCEAWTFHRQQAKGGCFLDSAVDCRTVSGAAAGCKKPPCKTGPAPAPAPAPAPPPPPPTPPKFPDFCKGTGKKCKNVLYFVADDVRDLHLLVCCSFDGAMFAGAVC